MSNQEPEEVSSATTKIEQVSGTTTFGATSALGGSKYDALYKEMRSIKEDVEKSKANYVQLLGLFSGIVAFILGTLQVTTTKLPFSEAVVIVITLGISLAIFVALIDRISVRKMPKFEFYLFIIIGVLVLGGILWFAFKYEKAWEQFSNNTATQSHIDTNIVK